MKSPDTSGEAAEAVTAQIEEQRTVYFDKPITIGSGDKTVPYESVTLREPTWGELKKAQRAGDEFDTVELLISQIGAIPRAVVEKMPQRKIQECADFFASFSPAKKA